MPVHKRVEVDTTSIMRYVLNSIAQQVTNGRIAGLRDSLMLAVQKIGEVAEAINDHANHFSVHHEGVAWSLRSIKTLDQDTKAEMSLIKGRLQELNGRHA